MSQKMFHPPSKNIILFLASVFPEECPDDSDVLRDIGFPANDTAESEEDLDFDRPNQNERVDSSFDSEEDVPNLFQLAERDIDVPIEYDQLPAYYIGLDSWPKNCNLQCWGCTNTFTDRPWFIPNGMTKKLLNRSVEADIDDILNLPSSLRPMPKRTPEKYERMTFRRFGCFCTPFCAERYRRRSRDERIINVAESGKLSLLLYEEMIGVKTNEIPEAEDKTVMMQFCGPKGITAQEYRDKNNKLYEQVATKI
jgi:hypothetical protein